MTKIIPRNQEVELPEDRLIVSKTDVKGRLLYANRPFMEISGFVEAELLGMPHNIIRHPDMPRSIFQLLWKTLQKGDEFNGYVKNICKNGSFYWVLANVSPDYDDQNKLRGYYSVRRKPSAYGISIISKIYEKMCKTESAAASPKVGMESASAILQEQVAETGLNYLQFITYLESDDAGSKNGVLKNVG